MDSSVINFFKKNILIIGIELLVIIGFAFFYGKFGSIMVDSYREAYIPWQMNEGNSLYKNIFCIYPPLSYIINAFLFKIFGNNLNVLYFVGLASTMGIFCLSYKISRLFLSKLPTAGICLFLYSGLLKISKLGLKSNPSFFIFGSWNKNWQIAPIVVAAASTTPLL